jgi:hypothetical protein
MKTESIRVSATLRLPVPENRNVVLKRIAENLARVGELQQFNFGVESTETVFAQNAPICPICGWTHDSGFTQMRYGSDFVLLSGILPDIVAVVHRAHEKGFPALSTKDDELLKICGGYGNPCKAFDDLRHRDDYKALFETGKRGFISLRGALGIIRNKSERISE